MPAYLDDILVAHRARVAADQRDIGWLFSAQAEEGPPVRGFAPGSPPRWPPPASAVIAEVKRHSPSKGDLDAGLDPAAWPSSTRGRGRLSVGADRRGVLRRLRPEDLAARPGGARLPVLRKDFTVAAGDVCDARLMGADAVLLIVAALSERAGRAPPLVAAASASTPWSRSTTRPSWTGPSRRGAVLIGVNQRDLATFEVDTDRAERVAEAFPHRVLAVAESGIRGARRRGAARRGRLRGRARRRALFA